MTDEEFNHLATLYGFAPSRPLREMLDAAVKAEREACARVCDGVHARHTAEYGDYIGETYAAECGRNIRARSKE